MRGLLHRLIAIQILQGILINKTITIIYTLYKCIIEADVAELFNDVIHYQRQKIHITVCIVKRSWKKAPKLHYEMYIPIIK